MLRFTRNPKFSAFETLYEYQTLLLNDLIRLDAYKKAIQTEILGGDVVVDLGCGLGILSLFACQSGAKKVYAIDHSLYSIQLAQEIAKKNAFGHKIEFLNRNSQQITREMIPEDIDLLVTETLGSFALEEDILTYLIDFRDRFLRVNHIKIIPTKIELYIVPYESIGLYNKFRLAIKSLKERYNLDFSAYINPIANYGFVLNDPQFKIKQDNFLAKPLKFAEINLATVKKSSLNVKFQITLEKLPKERLLHGFCGFFKAPLSIKDSTISLTNSPLAPDTHFSQMYFPLQNPLKIQAEATLELQAKFLPPSEWELTYQTT